MAETGTVFDIQRCSLHDGPGIRTTVFLKGCPLHCLWCHNPEAISGKPQLSYDTSRCVGCLECVTVCPHGAHQAHPGHALDFDLCQACGKCLEVCQGEALTMVGSEMTVPAVMDVVLKDRRFYDKSGGGVTISGGEPMAQFEFTLALLQACKQEGISTCLETSGMSSWERYQKVRHLTDLFLFDYKATGATKLQQLTGAVEKVVMSNLAKLLEAGSRVILRCPLVPGVNDSDEHIRAIADLSRQFPQLQGIELMAYHNLGIAKGERVGWTNPLPNVEPPTQEQAEDWLARLQQLGCENVRLS